MKLPAPRIFYIHAFWAAFAQAIVFTYYMVFQVEVALLTPLQLVLIGTALEVSAFVFEIPTGVVADVYSRRLSVIIGVFIVGTGFIVQGIPNFWVIAGGSALWGLGFTFTSGAHQAWIADEVGAQNVGAVFLRARQVGRAGALLGIPVSMALAGVGFQTPIITGGVLFLGLGLFLMVFMGEEGFSPTPPQERESWQAMSRTLKEGLALVRGRPVLTDFLLIGLFVGLYSEGYDRLWTAHLLENLRLPDLFGWDTIAWFGAIRIANALIGIGFNEWVRRRLDLNDMRKSVRMLQGLYLGMIAALFLLANTGSFGVGVAMLLAFSACRELTFPIQETWTNQFIESKVRATVLSVQSQMDALGQMAGGPIIGAAGNAFGIRAAMTLASAILLPVLPLYQGILRRGVRKSD